MFHYLIYLTLFNLKGIIGLNAKRQSFQEKKSLWMIYRGKIIRLYQIENVAGHQSLMPVVPGTQRAEIRRIVV
jgi:hypothetical protein